MKRISQIIEMARQRACPPLVTALPGGELWASGDFGE